MRWDQGLAILRCLRTALDVFNPGFPQQDRLVQVIRGVWGFVPYATEFWCVELREMASNPTESWDSRFLSTIAELSAVLAAARPGADDHHPGQLVAELESIRCLQVASLWYDATLSLQARSSGRHRITKASPAGKWF